MVDYNAGMSPVVALHHAARQYCIEQAQVWSQRYSLLPSEGRTPDRRLASGWDYTPEAYNHFPRYQVLATIRNEVEKFLPSEFASLDEARSLLALAGETASSSFTAQRHPIAIAAVLDERQQFVEFVRTIDHSQLLRQKSLPFRRVLSTNEHQLFHEAVVRRWGKWYGGYTDRKFDESEILTLHDAVLPGRQLQQSLQTVLKSHGVQHLFELREFFEGFEMPVESAEFNYNGAEGFWTSADADWLVYASHESSVTFGGKWLVQDMKAAIPDFERYIYKGWDRTLYP